MGAPQSPRPRNPLSPPAPYAFGSNVNSGRGSGRGADTHTREISQVTRPRTPLSPPAPYAFCASNLHSGRGSGRGADTREIAGVIRASRQTQSRSRSRARVRSRFPRAPHQPVVPSGRAAGQARDLPASEKRNDSRENPQAASRDRGSQIPGSGSGSGAGAAGHHVALLTALERNRHPWQTCHSEAHSTRFARSEGQAARGIRRGGRQSDVAVPPAPPKPSLRAGMTGACPNMSKDHRPPGHRRTATSSLRVEYGTIPQDPPPVYWT
jgi:hypothetical protein